MQSDSVPADPPGEPVIDLKQAKMYHMGLNKHYHKIKYRYISFMRIKIICSSDYTITRVKRKVSEWGKIIVLILPIIVKKLICKM